MSIKKGGGFGNLSLLFVTFCDLMVIEKFAALVLKGGKVTITNVGLCLITVDAAHGAIASHHIYLYIRKPYWIKETWPIEI
jgi:hypothetical protein